MTEKLKECPFERGQVWKNPDDELMLVLKTTNKFGGNCLKVEYVSQDGERGSFYSDNKAITENIERVANNSPSPDAERLAAILRQWIFLEQGMDASLRKQIYDESVSALADFEKGGLK